MCRSHKKENKTKNIAVYHSVQPIVSCVFWKTVPLRDVSLLG